MELQEENITFIKDAFNKMKSKEDFVVLLNYAKILVYGEKAMPFELKHITYHSNPKINKKRYVQFTVKKKSGAERIIHSPSKGLKAIQKCLNLIFQTIYNVNVAATGFVPGRSIVDNAKNHTGSLYVYNIDLKDFFPGIEAGRIWGRLQHPPFNLNEKTGRKELANIITWLCCHEMEVERMDENNEWQKVQRSVLPQGAPTSPTLTNIVCQQLDFYLSAAAKRFGLKYSRYADDITFSSMHNVFQKDSDFLKELHRIITEQHFHIKESKTRLQKQGYRQEVTGLLVNEKPNVQKRYVKELRMWLYYWEQYGYAKASLYFSQKYKADKGHVKKDKPNMANVIAGKLEYLKMVKGGGNEMYLKLRSRFDFFVSKEDPINSILDIWEKKGIENAMDAFYGFRKPLVSKKPNSKKNIVISFLMKETTNQKQNIEIHRDKNKFILGMLDYVVNRKMDPLVSDKLLKLLGNEIGKDDELNNEILERLGKVEKVLNDRKVEITEKVQLAKDGKGEDKEEKNIIGKKKFNSLHNPIQTTEILKRFKYINDSGFKELVHSPTDIESFTIVKYEEILNKTEQSFKILLNVPYLIYMNIKELNKLMHIEGKQVVELTNKHPYLNDFSPEIKLDNYENLSKTFPNKTITNLIQGFKKNYRFGFEETESSILKDLISHVFNKVSDKFNNARGNNENYKEFSFAKDPSSSGIIIDIHFSDLFDDFSVFFTWVPNVKNILYSVAEDILKHGNLTGSSEYKSHSKAIEFSIEKKYDDTLNCTKILFSILDKKSICKKSPALLFEQMKDKMDYLTRGICDWSIESDFDKGSYCLQFLPEPTTELSIIKLDEPIRGFKHTFTFYD